MTRQTVYIVSAVETESRIHLPMGEFPLKLSWADGMIGVCPVFETYEAALKYANGRAVLEAVIVEEP